LTTISLKVMSDSTTQTSGFQAGDLDFATAVNNQTVQSDDGLKKQAYIIDPFVCNYYMLVNAGDENTNKALKDADIRKALNMAIDRDAVVKSTGYGEYATALDKFIPKGIPGATGDFNGEVTEKYATYNLEEAKKIMTAKGYSADKMLKLTYSYNDLPLHKDVAQALQSNLKAAFIDLQLKVEEKQTFFDHRDAGAFELARHAMTADYLDPMAYLSMYYGSGTAANTVDDKKFESLVDAGQKLDKADRMNKFHEAEKYLVNEMNYIIPLFSYVDPILKASDLEGVTSSPEGHWDLTRAYYK
ncbi:MAG: ABC transporter substrate-binding protein, partial [Coprobacillus sp.]